MFVSHLGLPGGWVGVEVFVLSGYLITDRLLHEHRTTGRVRLLRFHLRRGLRLYPALLALLVAGAFFYPVLGDGGTLAGYARTAAFDGLYLQDFVWGFSGSGHGGLGHTWSLAVQEQFYLLWPLVLLLLLRWSRRWIALLAAAAAGAGLVWTIVGLEPATLIPMAYFLPWTQAPLLLAGCSLAAWRRLPRAGAAGACAALGSVGLVTCFAAASGPSPISSHLGVLLAGCALSTVALVAGVEGAGDRGIARCLSWAPLAYLGRISYGFYLFYLPVIEVVNWLIPETPSDVRAAVDLLVTLALAAVSYHLVELPFLRLKDRLEPAPARVATPSTGAVEDATVVVGRRALPGVPAPRRALEHHRREAGAPVPGVRVGAGR